MTSKVGEEQYIIFKLGENIYGINIQYVREVVEPKKITKLPKAPYYVEGIMDLRGKLITLVNLSRILNIEEGSSTNKRKVLIMNTGSINVGEQKTETGLIVDHVLGVLRANSVESEKNTVPSEVVDRVIRHQDKLILILDARKILELIGSEINMDM
ncbi:MAG: purine-binding chemotaxis protein CheW [Staphylothermus sp.]|nr:purine-binding chemotaxis protein CheW [Staphylothermus sp.]